MKPNPRVKSTEQHPCNDDGQLCRDRIAVIVVLAATLGMVALLIVLGNLGIFSPGDGADGMFLYMMP